MKQRKEWVPPGDTPKLRVKQDLHPKKRMICVWWDWEVYVNLYVIKVIPQPRIQQRIVSGNDRGISRNKRLFANKFKDY
ncbi:hypothetical protein COOONC_26016 [Cooperia oncophora]